MPLRAEEPEETPPPEPSVEVQLSPALQTDDVEGSREDRAHYRLPPVGLAARLLQAIRRDAKGFPLGTLRLRTPGEPGERAELDLHLRSHPSFLRFDLARDAFYADPQIPAARFASREDRLLRLLLREASPGPTLEFQLRDRRVSLPAIARYFPEPGIRYDAPELAARLSVPLAGGDLSLRPALLHFQSGTPRLPDSRTLSLAADYARALGQSADVGAGFEHARTEVAGLGAAIWNIFRLEGSARPTRTLFLDGYLQRESIDLPFSRSPLARRRDRFGLSFRAEPVRRLLLRGGLFREELRRVDSASGEEDRPAWTGGWLAARYSRPGRWTLDLRYRDRGLSGAPRTTIEGLSLGATLYATRRRSLDARLDVSPSDRWDAFLGFQSRRWENDGRHTRFALDVLSAGGVYRAGSRLSLTAEFSQQIASGRRSPYFDVLPPGIPPPPLPAERFFSNGRVLTAGLAWQIDARTSADLIGHLFHATGGQSAREHALTLLFRRDVSRDWFWAVGVEWDSQRYRREFVRGFRPDREIRRFRALPLLFQIGYRREFR